MLTRFERLLFLVLVDEVNGKATLCVWRFVTTIKVYFWKRSGYSLNVFQRRYVCANPSTRHEIYHHGDDAVRFSLRSYRQSDAGCHAITSRWSVFIVRDYDTVAPSFVHSTPVNVRFRSVDRTWNIDLYTTQLFLAKDRTKRRRMVGRKR
jgi:hypothetical protein